MNFGKQTRFLKTHWQGKELKTRIPTNNICILFIEFCRLILHKV